MTLAPHRMFIFSLVVLFFDSVYSSAASPKNPHLVAVSGKKSLSSISAKKTVPPQKQLTTTIDLSAPDIAARGFSDIFKLYTTDICIREVPVFYTLHSCFHLDNRLAQGKRLRIGSSTISALLHQVARDFSMPELRTSAAQKIDSIILFKTVKHRKNPAMVDFVLYTDPGSYEIPKTGASVNVPRKISGTIYRRKSSNQMQVYIYSRGVTLALPGYAKVLSLGMIQDADIGKAELGFTQKNWVARLIYSRTGKDRRKSGWSFNVTECNKIRPCWE